MANRSNQTLIHNIARKLIAAVVLMAFSWGAVRYGPEPGQLAGANYAFGVIALTVSAVIDAAKLLWRWIRSWWP